MKWLQCALMWTILCCSHVLYAGSEQTQYLTYVSPGQPVPVHHFVDINGEIIDLTHSNNNKLLVLFATWCPDSQRAIKALLARDEVQSPDYEVILIGREETAESLALFAKEYGVSYPLVADTERSIYARFANQGIPRLILLSGDNQIVKTIIAEDDQPLAELSWDNTSKLSY